MKKLINEPIDVIESFLKGTDDVLAGDFFKLLREGRREIGLCTGILRYYGTKGIELMRPKTYEYGNGKKARIYHQALGIANDSEHGLAGAVYSKDAERAKKVALAIETGQIFINQPSSAHPELPLGGELWIWQGDERHRIVRVCKRKNRRRLITFKYFLKKSLTFAVMLRFFYAMAADLRIGFRIY